MQALPLEAFPFFSEGRRSVHRDGHVEVAKAYYSVPPEYLGHELWARWDSKLVRIFDKDLKQVTVHCRVLPGRFHTLREHLDHRKISGVERGAEYLLSRAFRIGPSTGRWAKAMFDARGIEHPGDAGTSLDGGQAARRSAGTRHGIRSEFRMLPAPDLAGTMPEFFQKTRSRRLHPGRSADPPAFGISGSASCFIQTTTLNHKGAF